MSSSRGLTSLLTHWQQLLFLMFCYKKQSKHKFLYVFFFCFFLVLEFIIFFKSLLVSCSVSLFYVSYIFINNEWTRDMNIIISYYSSCIPSFSKKSTFAHSSLLVGVFCCFKLSLSSRLRYRLDSNLILLVFLFPFSSFFVVKTNHRVNLIRFLCSRMCPKANLL